VTIATAVSTQPAQRTWLPFALISGIFLAVKLVVFLWMNPIGDEAYYWLWGQHLDWSYFDHPPLHAWAMAAIEAVLGWNLWSLRALTLLTFGGTLLIFWDWARRLQPQAPAEYFWRATTIYLAAPLFLGMSTIVFNDHLMMFLVVASGHAMLVFAESVEANRPRYRWLYLSALLLGLAVLTKYNAVFLTSSVSMLVLASFAEVLFYWNIVAFILMIPLLPMVMRNAWLMGLHVAYGLGMAALLLVNQFYAPVGNLFGSYDWTISSTYGWEEIGREVDAARTEHDASFVGTTFYTTAAQLGFAIGDPDTVAISTRPDQFDVWFKPEMHRGETAIIVADSTWPIDYAASMFERITPLETLEISSFGRVIYTPTIYLMENFTPPAAENWK